MPHPRWRPAPPTLLTFLSRLADATGAVAASAYLPAWSCGSHTSCLVHHTGAPAVDELSDEQRLLAFEATLASTGRWSDSVVSRTTGGLLLPLPTVDALVGLDRAPGSARRGTHATAQTQAPAGEPLRGRGWIGLRFPDTAIVDARVAGRSATEHWRAVVAVAQALTSGTASLQSMLADPVTGLPGRSELQTMLTVRSAHPDPGQAQLACLLVNPQGIAAVNATQGKQQGDVVLQQVAHRLSALAQPWERVLRYGAATFAIVAAGMDAEAALARSRVVAATMEDEPYLDGTVRLAFAVGSGVTDDSEPGDDPWEVVRRAEVALAVARGASPDRVCGWNAALACSDHSSDRMRHVFTGRTDKDYRNMALLWDTLDVVTTNATPERVAHGMLTRFAAAFPPARLGVFEHTPGRRVSLLSGLRQATQAPVDLVPWLDADVTDVERRCVQDAVETGRAHTVSIAGAGSAAQCLAHMAPLVVGTERIGVLAMVEAVGGQQLDAADRHFLSAFAVQLAVAIDRARLSARREEERDLERRRLRAELRGLTPATRSSTLLYRSRQMEALLATARLAAPTDTTVLITGESGTGKERLAQAVHDLSGRRAKPLVVVDCSAIPTTLLERELFGHERGAFTGADRPSAGRLGDADGGTVLLDEIAELPLDVQAKLLRFVQEKEITPVGAARSRRVDVRIIAVTNRVLETEVAAGRFREDLFYRLNVVRLHIPALRDRPDDVAFLADHFLQMFAAEHGRAAAGFSPDAAQAIVQYGWPGNVRELQNRVLRAVVLSTAALIDALVLDLPAVEGEREVGRGHTPSAVTPAERAETNTASVAETPAVGDGWHILRRTLRLEVARIARTVETPLPLGRWLAHDLVMSAHTATSMVAARAASRIGVPESTFLRRLKRAQVDLATSRRTPTWPAVSMALTRVLTEGESEGEYARRVEDLALEEILSQAPDHHWASAVIGVSLPTLRRRLAHPAWPLTAVPTASRPTSSAGEAPF